VVLSPFTVSSLAHEALRVVAERRGITILNQIGFVCRYLQVNLWTKQPNVQPGTAGKTDPDMIYMESLR